MKQRVESKFQYCKLPCRPRKCRVERPAGDGWLGSCRSLEARPAPAGVGVGVGAGVGAGRGAGEPEPGMPPAEAAAPARRKKHCSPPRREAEARGPPSRARAGAGAGAGTWVPFRAVQFSSSTSGAFGRSPARPPQTAPYLTLAASSPLSLHSQLAQLGIAPGPPGRGSTPRVFQWAPASRPAAPRWPPLLGPGAGAGPGTAPWATPRTSPSATAPATAHSTNCREWPWASRHGLGPWERGGGGGGWGWGSGSGERPESPAAALAEALAARGLPAAAASPFPPGTDPALALVLLDEDNLSEVKAEREVQSWVALLPRGGAGAGACKGACKGARGGGGGDAAASASGSSSGLSCCGGVLLGRPKARLKRRGRGPVIRYAPSALAPAAPATSLDPAPAPAAADPTPGHHPGAAADGGCSPSQSPPQVDVCCSERRQLFLEISHARVCRPSPAVWPPAPAHAPAPATAPAAAPAPPPAPEPSPSPAPAPFTVSQPGDAKRPAKPQRCGPWGGRGRGGGRGGGRGRRAAHSGAEAEADLLPVQPMLCSAAEF